MSKTEELLYQCIQELCYVQSVENCTSGLCASAKGADLIELGIKELGVKWLGEDDLQSERDFEAAHPDGRYPDETLG